MTLVISQDILIGLLRLRKCSGEGTFRPELVDCGGCSIVRELHVYGTAVPVHARWDRKGFFRVFLAESCQTFAFCETRYFSVLSDVSASK